MKIYVDELPVDDCACNCDGFCQLLNQSCTICWRDMPKNKDCPLTLISDHDKQVRKEVCEEIREQLGLMVDGQIIVVSNGSMTGDKTILSVLDQIQGETK